MEVPPPGHPTETFLQSQSQTLRPKPQLSILVPGLARVCGCFGVGPNLHGAELVGPGHDGAEGAFGSSMVTFRLWHGIFKGMV